MFVSHFKSIILNIPKDSLAGHSKRTAAFKAEENPKGGRRKESKSEGQRERRGARDRERGSRRWSLTHLVGQGHKRRCLPGLQWSMKPPGECNRSPGAPIQTAH